MTDDSITRRLFLGTAGAVTLAGATTPAQAQSSRRPPQLIRPRRPKKNPRNNVPIIVNHPRAGKGRPWHLWKHFASRPPHDKFQGLVMHAVQPDIGGRIIATIWLYKGVPGPSKGYVKLKLRERYQGLVLEPLDENRPNKLGNFHAFRRQTCVHKPEGEETFQERQKDLVRAFSATATRVPVGGRPERRMVRLTTFLTTKLPPGIELPDPKPGVRIERLSPDRRIDYCEDYPDDAMLDEEEYDYEEDLSDHQSPYEDDWYYYETEYEDQSPEEEESTPQ